MDSTSSSDCASPVLDDPRVNRARGLHGHTGRAGRQSNFYTFPNLKNIHEDIEQKTMEELAEEIGRVKLARNEGTSPIIEGNISGSVNMKNSTVLLFATQAVLGPSFRIKLF